MRALRMARSSEAVVQAEPDGDPTHVSVLARSDEGDSDALGSGAPRAPDAVHVGLTVGRGIEVDHVRDAADVDTACGHVGGDKRVAPAGLKAVQCLLSLAL